MPNFLLWSSCLVIIWQNEGAETKIVIFPEEWNKQTEATSVKGIVLGADGCSIGNEAWLWLLSVCEWHTGIYHQLLLGPLQPCCWKILFVKGICLCFLFLVVPQLLSSMQGATTEDLLRLYPKQVISAAFRSEPIPRCVCLQCWGYHSVTALPTK